jgi:hypothetical protein
MTGEWGRRRHAPTFAFISDPDFPDNSGIPALFPTFLAGRLVISPLPTRLQGGTHANATNIKGRN